MPLTEREFEQIKVCIEAMRGVQAGRSFDMNSWVSKNDILAVIQRWREPDEDDIDTPVLFQSGDFTLHSGDKSNFKIDCDALTDEDIESLAMVVTRRVRYSSVYGIPTGGIRLAKALEKYCYTEGPRLVVDDVLTTGNSMNEVKREGDLGIVIFARGKCPDWVVPIFQMNV